MSSVATVAQLLSPLKNVLTEGVPVADKSTVPKSTDPSAETLLVTVTNVPAVLLKSDTKPVVALDIAVTLHLISVEYIFQKMR